MMGEDKTNETRPNNSKSLHFFRKQHLALQLSSRDKNYWKTGINYLYNIIIYYTER